MNIQSTQPSLGRILNAPQPEKPPTPENSTPPQESFTPHQDSFLDAWGPTLGAAAVGAGLGVFAGLGTGVMPAIAGAAAGTGFGVVAAAGTARAGFSEASAVAGAVGLFGGAILGGYTGYAVSSPVAAIALGAAGGVGFAFYKAMSAWN